MSGAWWEQRRGDAGGSADRWAQSLAMAHAERVTEARVLLEIYGDPHASLIAPYAGEDARSWGALRDGLRRASKLGLNVLRSCVETACARIGAQEPEPAFLSRRGDATRQRAARTRTRYVSGTWRAAGMRPQMQRVLRYAALTGLGVAKVAVDGGRIWVDALLPGELLWDPEDALHGCPSVLGEVRWMAAGDAHRVWGTEEPTDASRRVRVVEAWRVPRGAESGRHVVTVDGRGVLDEEVGWHPYAWMSWREPWGGIQSLGLGQELLGLQLQINAVLRQVEASVRAGGNLHLLVPRASAVRRQDVSNELGAHWVEYSGQPPTWLIPPTVDPGLMSWLQFLVGRAYEMSGISELTAAGTMPAGLAGSGRAQLVYAQIESQRFVHTIRAWERLHERLADLTLRAAVGMGDEAPAVGARRADGSWLDQITLRDLALDDDEPLAIETHTQAGLPVTPAGRLAYAMQLQQLGLLQPSELRQMLQLPDTEADEELATAPADLIDAQIESILESGEVMPPTSLQDLAECRRRGVLAHQRAMLDGADEERLAMLEEWIAQVDALMAMQAVPASPDAPAQDVQAQEVPGGE